MPSLSKVSWLLVFTLFALPLLFFPFTYLAFELPKVFLLYLFSSSAAYLLFVSGYRPANLTKTHWVFLIFFIWILITAILGLSLQQSFLGSYFRMQGIITWICYGLLFFISGKLFEDHYFKKYACLALLVSSSFTAIFALIQFIFLWFFGNTAQLLYSNRVISTFGQPNFLGAYLVMSLPFIWFLFKHYLSSPDLIGGSNYLWIPAFAGMTIVLIVLGIFATLSRSAYLGLAVLAVIWGFYHYRLLLTGIIFSILLFALLANLFPNLVYQEWSRFKVDTVVKWTAENRLQITQKSIQLIAQKPIIGYGLENFSLAFPTVISIKDLGLKDIVVDSSHNLFLDLAVQTGLVGLGLFLLFVTSTIISGLKQSKSKTLDNKDFTRAAICAVIAFLIIHQFSPYSVVPMVLFWCCLGIISQTTIQHYPLHKGTKYIIHFIGITLISITILFEVQTIRSEIFFREASAYEVSDIYKAIDLDNKAIKLSPWTLFYQVRKNFLLKQLGY